MNIVGGVKNESGALLIVNNLSFVRSISPRSTGPYHVRGKLFAKELVVYSPMFAIDGLEVVHRVNLHYGK